MQLHELKPNHKLKSKKPRVGRGGKRGTYSGKGQKGQKAHAGRRIKPAVSDLIIRLPKLRGFKNTSLKSKPLVINLDDLKKIEGGVINKKSLLKSGLISKTDLRKSGEVKILGEGDVGRSFVIDGLKVSRSAKKKIEAAAGSVK